MGQPISQPTKSGFSRRRDRSFRISREGVEAAEIGLDRRPDEVAGCLRRDEGGAGPGFPFDEGAGVIAGLGEHDAQIKASAACAEG